MIYMGWFLKGLFLIGLIEAKHHKLGQLFFLYWQKNYTINSCAGGKAFYVP